MATSHVLIIGISHYKRAKDRLRHAREGAERLEKILASQYIFASITSLYDKQASLDNILRTLHSLQRLGRTDNLLIVFAGHAKKISGRWYFLPQDSSLSDKFYRQFVSEYELLVETLGSMKSGHIFLLIDACYGGMLVRGGVEPIGVDMEEALQQEMMAIERPSRFILTAGNAFEVVPDGGGDRGNIFMDEVCTLLEENEATILTASALSEQIEQRVLKRTTLAPVKCHPVSGHVPGYNTGGVFCFERKKRARTSHPDLGRHEVLRQVGRCWTPREIAVLAHKMSPKEEDVDTTSRNIEKIQELMGEILAEMLEISLPGNTKQTEFDREGMLFPATRGRYADLLQGKIQAASWHFHDQSTTSFRIQAALLHLASLFKNYIMNHKTRLTKRRYWSFIRKFFNTFQ